MNLAIPRVFWIALLIGAIGHLTTFTAKADIDIYTVAGVPVDVTADTVIAARENAEALGQREGLQRLLRKLTTPEHFASLPDINGVDIGPLVRSFGVDKEQFSANRYIAEVTASFRGDAVQKLLQGRGVPIILQPSEPLLVVPARSVNGQLRIASRDDDFSKAWNLGHNRNTLLDIRLPLGDLLDARQIPVSGDASAIVEGLEAMASRYGTSSAVLIIAEGGEVDGSGNLDPSAQISFRLGGQVGWDYGSSSFALSAGDENVWQQSVAASLQRLEQPWKSDRLVRFDRVETILVTALLEDLDSWTQISKALATMPEVRATSLTRFTQRQAVFSLQFIGGTPQLQRSLENKGLSLSSDLGQWQIAALFEQPDHSGVRAN